MLLSDTDIARPQDNLLCQNWILKDIQINGKSDTLNYPINDDELIINSDGSFIMIDKGFDIIDTGHWQLISKDTLILTVINEDFTKHQIILLNENHLQLKLLNYSGEFISYFESANSD